MMRARGSLVVAAIVTGVIALGACGSSSSSSDQPSETTKAKSSAAASTTTTAPPEPGVWVAAQIEDLSVVQRSEILMSTDGKAWNSVATINDTIWSVAYGDGTWLATGDPIAATNAGQIFASTDLTTWTSVATLPEVALRSIAYGDGQWTGVGIRSTANSATSNVIMTSTDGKQWSEIATMPSPLDEVAYGDGTWIAIMSEFTNGVGNMRTVTSTDGKTWKQTGSGLPDVTTFALAYGDDDGWFAGGRPSQQNEGGFLAQSPDGAAWTKVTGAAIARQPVQALADSNDSWLGVMNDEPVAGDEHGNATATFFTSADGKQWTRAAHLDEMVSSVAYGPAEASPSSATTTTVANAGETSGGAIEKIDWKNYSYPDNVCATEKDQKLTNSEWMQPGVSYSCGMSFVRVGFGDVNGDGAQEAVVTIMNNASGTGLGVSYNTYVYAMQDGNPKLVGTLAGEGFPPYKAGGIDVWNRLLTPDVPTCCPKEYTITSYKYANGTFVEAGTRTVPVAQYPGKNG